MNKKFISSVTGASIFLVIITIFSKGLGFIRQMIFASFFGLSHEFDIYLIGAVLPLTINTIILYLGQNYLIPAYNRIKENDNILLDNFIQINFFAFIFGGCVVAVILYFFSGIIVDLYLHVENPDILSSTKLIFRLFLLSLPFNFATSVLSAYQQIHFEFRYPAFSQLIASIAFILLLIIFRNTIGIYIIPAGYVTGSILQVSYLFNKSKIKIRFDRSILALKKYKKYIPHTLYIIILIESIGQLYLIVDRYFYNYVPTGGIASLNYAQTVFLLPISILSIAFSTAIFPKFSKFVSLNLFEELERSFNEGIKVNIVIFIPITFLFIFYGDFFLKIFFERGKFSSTDTLVTYHVLIFYSISMIFYSVYSVINKLIYGLGLIKNLLYITVIGIFIKIFMNFLLVGKLAQDGLALSTSISFLFFFVASLSLIYLKVPIKNKSVFLTEVLFQLTNAFIALFITTQIMSLYPNNPWSTLAKIILFVTFYFLNLFIAKHSSIKLIDSVINSLKS